MSVKTNIIMEAQKVVLLREQEEALLALAKTKSAEWHRAVNQRYDGKDYFDTHILRVVRFAEFYKKVLPQSAWIYVTIGAYLHDVIEDTGKTYNDIFKVFGLIPAEIAYACTNDKGRTRKARAGFWYYLGIRRTKYASYVKLVDRLANFSYSWETGSSMFKTYQKEHPDFIKSIKGTHTWWGKARYFVKKKLGLLEADYETLYDNLDSFYHMESPKVRVKYDAS